MKKHKFFLIIFFFIINNSFSQTGVVDCSPVVKSSVLNKDMHYAVYLP
ncbi:hypothetical protein SAMN04488111_1197 [Lutibacter flavus]|uniref:Uncharacterized protein n=1 Tax=Lutibacter flavus TaxID=691689 RepID=A0A238VYR8_9FLAO|nr:hypothetical protein SAMN04488111_1197 [Lutibacter flavus]